MLEASQVRTIVLGTLSSIVCTSAMWMLYRASPRGRNTLSPAKSGESSRSALFNPDPLREYSEFQSCRTKYAYYASIRRFYRPHTHAGKLPEIAKLPLLVFAHGLGGSLAQFAPLLRSLTNIAPCFGIDMPGCGMSAASTMDYNAYTIEAFATLLKTVTEEVCRQYGHERVVFISHSMGCSVTALLISHASDELNRLDIPAAALIAICPKATPLSPSQVSWAKKFFSLPDLLFDGFRWMDGIGGTESKSVLRFVGKEADIGVKTLQYQYNKSFPTSVWKRTAYGLLPHANHNVDLTGIPGKEQWEQIRTPLMLITGDADAVTPPAEAEKIVLWLRNAPHTRNPVEGTVERSTEADEVDMADDRSFGLQPALSENESQHSTKVISATLPKPAGHALMYDHSTYRTVAGLIEDFLTRHASEHLSLGWQLQQLTTSGKWDVKNLVKWQKTLPVSGPIANRMFRSLKTLREQDEEHAPSMFVPRWAGKLYAVVDISHDAPIYDTNALNKGGIQYHKFPTISKVPPTVVEVDDFIALIDRLRQEIRVKWPDDHNEHSIGVHCHYGFNRTGFFIVSYLVEREGWQLQEALDEFALRKPPGIKHQHFIDTLFMRYCVGLRRASTAKTNDDHGAEQESEHVN